MKVFLFSAIVLLTTTSFADRSVYICVSKSSYAYHYDRNCRGLSRCTHEVRMVTEEDAKNDYGRRLCGYED